MTALTTSHVVTPIDRVLLHIAAELDRIVAARLERRAARVSRPAAQDAASDARATAQALGAVGILPR